MKTLKYLLLAAALLTGSTVLFASNEKLNSGTVAETIDVGSYVYVRLEDDGGWLAGPPSQVKVGDRIVYGEGTLMTNFHSSSLDRNFESIRFVNILRPASAAAGTTPANPHAGLAPAIGHSRVAEAPAAGEIAPLEGGNTVAGIFANAGALDGKQVSLRARVIKVNQHIMGTNWITLQDGSGEPPDNKLLATSTDLVDIGDLVVVSGVVHKDVDIGSGYFYKVLLEEATFTQ